MDAERLSVTIEHLYAAGIGFESWQSALQWVFALVDAPGGGLVRTVDGVRTIHASLLEHSVKKEYDEYFSKLDHVIEDMEAGHVGIPRSGAELIWPRMDTEFCADWVRSADMCDGIFVRVDITTTLVCGHPRGTESYATSDRLEVVRLIAPHLRQALAIQAATGLSNEVQRSVESALDTVDKPMVLVSATGEIQQQNTAAAALISECDGVMADSWGRLIAHRADAKFRAALAGATASVGRQRASMVVIPRPSGRSALIASVSPLESTDAAPRRAIVVLTNPERRPTLSAALIAEYFRLTDSEARVAVLLAAGLDIATISDELCVARSTVRTHLRHLFEKTRTSRQAELALTLEKLAHTSLR